MWNFEKDFPCFHFSTLTPKKTGEVCSLHIIHEHQKGGRKKLIWLMWDDSIVIFVSFFETSMTKMSEYLFWKLAATSLSLRVWGTICVLGFSTSSRSSYTVPPMSPAFKSPFTLSWDKLSIAGVSIVFMSTEDNSGDLVTQHRLYLLHPLGASNARLLVACCATLRNFLTLVLKMPGSCRCLHDPTNYLTTSHVTRVWNAMVQHFFWPDNIPSWSESDFLFLSLAKRQRQLLRKDLWTKRGWNTRHRAPILSSLVVIPNNPGFTFDAWSAERSSSNPPSTHIRLPPALHLLLPLETSFHSPSSDWAPSDRMLLLSWNRDQSSFSRSLPHALSILPSLTITNGLALQAQLPHLPLLPNPCCSQLKSNTVTITEVDIKQRHCAA